MAEMIRLCWLGALLLGLPACAAAMPDASPSGLEMTEKDAVDRDEASALVFEPAELDLGSVKEGEKAEGYLLVRNTGADIETIVSMRASCGCTAAEAEERVLMPGAFTRVNITIDTFAKQGDTKKWIELIDGKGRRRRALLHLHVLPNPHLQAGGRGIFAGECAACHFDPAKGKRSGAAIYRAVCSMCHGENAEGGHAPSLRGFHDGAVLAERIARGTGSRAMPGFAREYGGPLDREQIKALSEWLLSLDD